jgi:S-methylmethionine-dependent homocysteine/selenocysteine methylase
MSRQGILDRLGAGDVLVHDGATGTELEARGFACDSGIWSAVANLEAPELLRAIHEDYLRAGADIITDNNYCTSPSFLDRNGEGARWRDYSQAGLEIAIASRDAINPDAYVAGGISPEGVFGHELFERARLLADGGADFILVEYVPSVSDCVDAVQACAEIDLPLFLGVGNLGADGNLADETGVEKLVDALDDYRVDGLLAMCTFPPAISKWMPRLRNAFSGIIGAYAHGGWTGKPAPSDNAPDFGGQIPHYTPAALAEYAQTWKGMGAQVIGGCCGTGPAHIVALPAAVL